MSDRPLSWDAISENERRWREDQWLRHECRRRTAYFIRTGRLVRGPCEVCRATKVHAHHEDYRHPERVRWLCGHCHHAVHHRGLRLLPKTFTRVTAAPTSAAWSSDLSPGDRVTPQAGLYWQPSRWRLRTRQGTVTRLDRDQPLVYVRWDGTTTETRLARGFVVPCALPRGTPDTVGPVGVSDPVAP